MEYNPLPTWDQYEIAEKNGISKSTVYQRINIQGWTVEKAITEPLFVSMKERYAEQWKIAEKNGILYRTFRSRITNLKWSPEEAATIPTLSTKECVERAQKKIDIIKPNDFARAIKHSVGKATLRERVFRLKWDLERAITTPPNIKHRAKKEAI